MRIEVKITAQNQRIILPSSHNHILQGFIYSLMEASLRRRVHQQGFQYEKRKFRLFTFSRLYGRFKNIDNQFHFTPPVRLIISSSQKEILQSIAENLVKTEKFYIGKNEVFIESINVLPQPVFRGKLIIKMLSPITCYSTLKKADGGKKTYYYSPFEQEFPLFIKENLRKKFQLIYGRDNDFEFNISPYRVSARDEKIIIYNRSSTDRGTVIKAWMGLYEIFASKKALELAYDVGLGAKNSQGFGCWEAINNN